MSRLAGQSEAAWGFESPAVVVRKGDNELALSLIGHEARKAMTRRVYSERYGKPIDRGDRRPVMRP